MNTDNTATTGLAEYGRIVRDQWWIVLSVMLVAVAVALVLTWRQDTRYAATAQLDFAGESQSLGIVGAPTFPSRTSKELAEFGAQTILQVSSLHRVRKALATDVGVTDLRRDLTAAVDPQSNLVSVTAQASDPNFAAALANALARQAAESAAKGLREQYRAAALDLRRREITLGQGPKDTAQSALYNQQITRLQALANIAQPVSIAKQAQPDDSPVSPKPVRNGVLGAIVGLLLGLLAAFVRDSFDKRLRNLDDVQDVLDMPILGHLRDEAMGGAGPLPGAVKLAPIDLETFSILRANLRHLDGGRPRQAIAVTSAAPGEGKSTIAASLALSSALAGHRTLLVEADLRRPSLAERLGLAPDGPGLTDYLAGTATPAEVVSSLSEPALPLAVVLAGSPSSMPVELLGSATFADFVTQVRGAYEVIIFDTSPLLTVADTLELLPHVDATVMCVRAGQTRTDEARAASAVLAHVPHGAVGLVITGVKRGRESDVGYYSRAYEREIAPLRAA